MTYFHPLMTLPAIRAQARWREISGRNRTHFCGAYWFYGFHEDGLNSAIRVAQSLGVDWRPEHMESAIYFGTLRHRRFIPGPSRIYLSVVHGLPGCRSHSELMQCLVLPAITAGTGRAFDDRDHFGDARKPLRERLAEDAARHGLNSAGRKDLPAHPPALPGVQL